MDFIVLAAVIFVVAVLLAPHFSKPDPTHMTPFEHDKEANRLINLSHKEADTEKAALHVAEAQFHAVQAKNKRETYNA